MHYPNIKKSHEQNNRHSFGIIPDQGQESRQFSGSAEDVCSADISAADFLEVDTTGTCNNLTDGMDPIRKAASDRKASFTLSSRTRLCTARLR